MAKDFLTLDDVDVKGKTVFVRVDINSPLDPASGQILDDSRIKAAVSTLEDLREAKVVIGSHQSRPGKIDFISLEAHTEVLKWHLGSNVIFAEDVMGPKAQEAISGLMDGEVLVLDNLRLCSEEVMTGSPEKLAQTLLVTRLALFFDLYVNDAFAAAHRSQASIVGFPQLLPAVAGRTMERELKVLSALLTSPQRPCVYVLGGVKVDDRIPVIENILKTGKADKILLGGLLAEFFLKAKGHKLGNMSDKKLAEFLEGLPKAKELLETYSDKIVLPVDMVVSKDGKAVKEHLKDMPTTGSIMDLGVDTIAAYRTYIQKAGVCVADGPLGVFEKDAFATGTRELLKALSESNAFSVVGGGHIGGAAEILGLKDKLSHLSTGGGAMLAYLSGQGLPALEALKSSAQRFGKGE